LGLDCGRCRLAHGFAAGHYGECDQECGDWFLFHAAIPIGTHLNFETTSASGVDRLNLS
jgi:hypothetical protein